MASEAFSMAKVSKIVKSFKDPHREKIQRLKGRYQELDELSNVAVEIGDTAAYKSLQVEMKEVFFDYLTAIVVDSVYKLVPHVLIIWLISLKWSSITIPIINRNVNILGGYLIVYLMFNFGQLFARKIWNRLFQFGITVFRRLSTTH
ncbi:hypothetical protein [Desulfosporosinus sp. SB140]|uniref:hypothetical protein n=1 Tax=Desulfosporosinus paludis TaxID=3115649 RepID=UPI00388FAB56